MDPSRDAGCPLAQLPRAGLDRLLFGHHGGVLSSTDGGRRWTPLDFGEDAMGMAAAADGSIVVAGHGVFQASRDGGASWTPIDADLPSLDIHGFARSLTDPARMWAYLAEGGVYESTDFGATWTKVTDGHVIHLTAIRQGDADGLWGIDPYRGLVRSLDGGRTWEPAGKPPTSPVTSLAAAPDGRILVMGGTRRAVSLRRWRHDVATHPPDRDGPSGRDRGRGVDHRCGQRGHAVLPFRRRRDHVARSRLRGRACRPAMGRVTKGLHEPRPDSHGRAPPS